MFSLATLCYLFLSYLSDKESFFKTSGLDNLGITLLLVIQFFQILMQTWCITLFKLIDQCIIALKHSRLYGGENYSIHESKEDEKEKEKSKSEYEDNNSNKIEVLDYFGPRKFEESKLPSFSSSKSESFAESEFGSYF